MNETTSKYKKYANLLKKVETSKLFKNREIDGNEKLEKFRQEDIEQLNILISKELKKDGILKMVVGGKTFYSTK